MKKCCIPDPSKRKHLTSTAAYLEPGMLKALAVLSTSNVPQRPKNKKPENFHENLKGRLDANHA